VWVQAFRDGPDSVLAALSTDSGKSWRRLPALPFTGEFQGLSATADRDGGIHVAAVANVLAINAWRNGSWSHELTILDASDPISIAAVVDTIYATWTTVHHIRSWQIPTTTAATLALCPPHRHDGEMVVDSLQEVTR